MGLTKLTPHVDNPEWQTVDEILLTGNKRFPAVTIHSLFTKPPFMDVSDSHLSHQPLSWNAVNADWLEWRYISESWAWGNLWNRLNTCHFFLLIKLVPVIFWCSLVRRIRIPHQPQPRTSHTVLIVHTGLKWLRFPMGLVSNASPRVSSFCASPENSVGTESRETCESFWRFRCAAFYRRGHQSYQCHYIFPRNKLMMFPCN